MLIGGLGLGFTLRETLRHVAADASVVVAELVPAMIEGLETEIAGLHATMAEPGYYKQAGDLLARDQARLSDLETRLAEAFARWEALDAGA